MSEIQWLENELKRFAKKYYLNIFLQRLAIFVLFAFVLVFSTSYIEYAFWMGSGARRATFFIGTGLLLVFFIRFLSGPLIELMGFRKSLSDRDFALLIGKHFSDIDDKILNTLELNQEHKLVYSRDLILASIQQKLSQIRLKDFRYALDRKKTLRRMPYLFVPLVLFLIMSFTIPNMIIGPLSRISHFTEEYSKPAPFEFEILNRQMSVPQNSDFELRVRLKGKEIPEDLFIEFNSIQKRMSSSENNTFIYRFANIKNGIKFRLLADGYYSDSFDIDVYKKPVIIQYNLKCTYPAYTGKQQEVFSNVSQLVVPRGTNISITVLTRDADKLHVFSDSIEWKAIKNDRYWNIAHSFVQSTSITMFASNKRISASDSLDFLIDVIPDEYPKIHVEEDIDSLALMYRYFTGSVSDDYGLSKLEFVYKLSRENYQRDSLINIVIDPMYNDQEFYNAFDFSVLGLKPGDRLEYFFRVYDNDAVFGAKSSRSRVFVFNMPDKDEIDSYLDNKSDQIENEMTQLYNDAASVQKEMEKLLNDLKYKNKLEWDERERIDNLLEKEHNIEDRLDQMNRENQSKLHLEQQLGNYNEDIFEKQRQINELMEEVMSDEMRELLEQLEELMKQNDKELKQNLDQLQQNNEDLLQNMDRTLELYKHLKAEKDLEDLINNLDELGDKELEESKSDSKKDREERQDELNKDFDKLQEAVDSLKSLNDELEDPFDLEGMDKKMQQIDSTMQKASEQLQKGKIKKGGQSQQSAGEQMKELAEQLDMMQMQMEQENLGEDINVVRNILENLIQTSFDQEKVMKNLLITRIADPKYLDLIRDQKLINDNFQVIRDSLISIGKRQPMIKNVINEELNKIMYHGENVMNNLQNRHTVGAATEQQFSLMSMNNLALLLADALKHMQNSMNQQIKSGSSQCKKPGDKPGNKPGNKPGQKPGDKPSAKSMRQLQEQLNQQMEALQKQMQEGGGQTPGMSEQLAKMTAQQEMIRKAMQDYQQQLNSEGAGSGTPLNKTIEDMEKTEVDLVNKNLTSETLQRQREILTRLLESEKAEMERDLDQKRESNEANFINNGNPVQFFKYNSLKRRNGMELLKTVPPNLNPFYKQKVSEYLYKLK